MLYEVITLAKFNFNSVMIYSYFGYACRLPYWDRELLQFFRDLPLEHKVHKKLYNEILTTGYFGKYGLNFTSELQPTRKQFSVQRWKAGVKKVLVITSYSIHYTKLYDHQYTAAEPGRCPDPA